MNWYKLEPILNIAKHSKSIQDFSHNIVTNPILDKIAFGFDDNEIQTVHPNDIYLIYNDLDNVLQEIQQSNLTEIEWAKTINLQEPIDLDFENNQFQLQDGHHRYYAAKILNTPLKANVTIKDNPITKLGFQNYDQFLKDIYKQANLNNTIQDEANKYETLKDFENNYEILYHGGSENIIGEKLVLGGRTPGEVTKENLGKGQDYGGIFFTPEKEFAQTFSHYSPSGIGKVHSFAVKTNNLFDQNNPQHTEKLKNFIGKYYPNEDNEMVEFTFQMYDFVFPKLSDGKRYMDWATFEPNVLETMGFEGAKVIENYDYEDENDHLYSYVLFTGGQESPHWKVNDDQSLLDIYNTKNIQANNTKWYKQSKLANNIYFLDNGNSAWKWAKENVDVQYIEEDLEKDPNNPYIQHYIENSINNSFEYSNKYNQIKNLQSVTIYRAIQILSLNDINWNNIGTHWSFEKQGAGVYGDVPFNLQKRKNAITIIITAEINPKYIDWEYGFTSFMYYGTDQWECSIDDNTPLNIIAINDKEIKTDITAFA